MRIFVSTSSGKGGSGTAMQIDHVRDENGKDLTDEVDIGMHFIDFAAVVKELESIFDDSIEVEHEY